MVPYTIDDPITEPLTSSVEVTIDLGGQKRWLFFVTPQLLASVGDFVEDTRVRLHLGERYMVVVSELSEAVIDKVLHHLDANGELSSRTLLLE
jgi:hypothetical protein